ncbi:hypothetical protein IWX46DRAFT_266960 [Phyllosticta citricarpa]|uniref:Zn(2)-C6 fungal-type domain-containing protein n=1 Tax=Phyllosticta citricarpa TaxID=55181 RepID=A0ABR1LP42_9PEZI
MDTMYLTQIGYYRSVGIGSPTPPPYIQEETAEVPRRQRVSLACSRCRKRKIRCSGDQNGAACTNCQEAGVEEHCQFLRVGTSALPNSGLYQHVAPRQPAAPLLPPRRCGCVVGSSPPTTTTAPTSFNEPPPPSYFRPSLPLPSTTSFLLPSAHMYSSTPPHGALNTASQSLERGVNEGQNHANNYYTRPPLRFNWAPPTPPNDSGVYVKQETESP